MTAPAIEDISPNHAKTAAARAAYQAERGWTKLPICKGTTKTGRPCRSWANALSGYCYGHDKTVSEGKRREDRAAMGHGRKRTTKLKRLVPPRLLAVYERLEDSLVGVLDGSIPANRATAAASVATAMVKVLHAGEIEERIRSLEGSLKGEGDVIWEDSDE